MTAHDHSDAAHASSGANDHRRRLSLALAITGTILLAQGVGAFVTGSLALLVDTAHMLTDVAGLAIALTAASLSVRPATSRRTWGLRRVEVLAAGGQAAVLLVVGMFVLVEGVQRLVRPPEVASAELVLFGAIGLAGNLASMLVLSAGRTANFNMRAAFLEVLNDALGSVGVIAAAVVIATTGWQRADAVAGLLIGALILPRALKLLIDTGNVLLEATPPGLDLDAVRARIVQVDHVMSVHDLHASLVATGLPTLSAHVVVSDDCFHDGHAPRILDDLQQCVAGRFDVSVEHSTFQLEPSGHATHEAATHS